MLGFLHYRNQHAADLPSLGGRAPDMNKGIEEFRHFLPEAQSQPTAFFTVKVNPRMLDAAFPGREVFGANDDVGRIVGHGGLVRSP